MKRKRESYNSTVQRDPTLPVLQRSADVQTALAANDVLVIIADTGSGKTTQIPQLILDAQRDANIVITQPRRVAAMTVAARVAAERSSTLGEHVGYTVRFSDKSQRGITRIRYVTDGVLLREALLEGPYALRNRYSHLIIDEVHERSVGTDVVLGLVQQILSSKTLKQPSVSSSQTSKGTGILSKLKPSQLSFKVVIMSATTDDRKLTSFFRGAHPDLSVGVLRLPGRLHPIRTLYSTTQLDDYVHAAVETVIQIHADDVLGDILVFLAGMEDISSALAILSDRIKSLPPSRAGSLVALPLYAALPPAEQLRAIDPLPPLVSTSQGGARGTGSSDGHGRHGQKNLPVRRKVVFATNVAETSITIPGVTFVVDCGVVKVRDVRGDRGFVSDVLRVQAVSRAQADQRAGRAGRTSSGTVYRLYTEEQYGKFTPFPKPELLRIEAAGPALQVIALAGAAAARRQQQERQKRNRNDRQMKNVNGDGKSISILNKDEVIDDAVDARAFLRFPLVDRVPRKALERALETLAVLGALDRSMRLTELGRVLARIPTTPQLGRALLESLRLGCAEAMTSVAAILSVEGSVFVSPTHKIDQARAAHRRFLDGSGDHLTLANVLHEFIERREEDRVNFCREHFLNARTLAGAAAVRRQLADVVTNADMSGWALRNAVGAELAADVAEAGAHELVRRALVAGFFRNIARKRAHDGQYVLLGQPVGNMQNNNKNEQEDVTATVDVHPSSALRTLRKRRNPAVVLFDEVVLTSKVYMRTVTAVELRWLTQHTTFYRNGPGIG